MGKQELRMQIHEEYIRKYIELGEKMDEAMAPILKEYDEALEQIIDDFTSAIESLDPCLGC